MIKPATIQYISDVEERETKKSSDLPSELKILLQQKKKRKK